MFDANTEQTAWPADPQRPIAVLASGGLDSCILVAWLLRGGHLVQPIYIRSGLIWETAERHSLLEFLDAVRQPALRPLIELDLPLADLYGDHWSITGRDVPGADTPDEAVFLPGRNALLVVKTVVWCQLHAVPQLAVATLGTSPFYDASAAFFAQLETALHAPGQPAVKLLRPFAEMNKKQVMQLGSQLPLELTFSCISPRGLSHCGMCNKCAERRRAFAVAGLDDPTAYASQDNIESEGTHVRSHSTH